MGALWERCHGRNPRWTYSPPRSTLFGARSAIRISSWCVPIYLSELGIGRRSRVLDRPCRFWGLKFIWAFCGAFAGRAVRETMDCPGTDPDGVDDVGHIDHFGGYAIVLLLLALLVLNFLAAVQDVAVDGLAVDLLPPDELGIGNAAQVVGYKFGMMLAGGVLVWATGAIGWSGVFVCMAALIAAVALLVSSISEPVVSEGVADGEPKETLWGIVAALIRGLPSGGWALLVVAIQDG